MKRVKVFYSDEHLETDINKWVNKEHVEILSVTPAVAKNQYSETVLVTILYDDGQGDFPKL